MKKYSSVHRKRLWSCALPIVLFLFLGAMGSPAVGSEQIGQYEVLELAFTATGGGDPYTEKGMTATFIGILGETAGHSMTIGGFWDGGKTWKVRFSPDHPGTYSYTISSSDEGLNGKSGTIAVGVSDRRGRIKVHSKYSSYFQWSNGDPFIMIGDTWWCSLFTGSDVRGSFSDSDWNTAVMRRIAQKFNYAHVVVWLKNNLGELHGQHPFFDDDKDKINPYFFQHIDKRIQYAAERQLVIGILLGWADHGYWTRFSTAQSNRFAQYLINRYAAYPVVWSGIGEYDEGGSASQWYAFADYFRNNDPYRNLVTMHPERDGKMTEQGHLDYYIVQRFSDLFDHARNSRSKGMPYVNSEYGYEGTKSTAQAILTKSWRLIMGGSAGLVYGNHPWWAHANVSQLNSDGARYIQYLSEFWQENGIQCCTFNSFSDMGRGRFEAKTNGGQHIYWTENPGSFIVDLSDLSGAVPARWYDARTGKWGNEFSLTAAQSVSVSPPDAYYALLVGQASSAN